MSQHGSRSTCLRADSTTLPAAPSRVKHAVNTNKQKNFGVWRGEEEQELCELCRERCPPFTPYQGAPRAAENNTDHPSLPRKQSSLMVSPCQEKHFLTSSWHVF